MASDKKKSLPSKKIGGNVDKFKKAFSDAQKTGKGSAGKKAKPAKPVEFGWFDKQSRSRRSRKK